MPKKQSKDRKEVDSIQEREGTLTVTRTVLGKQSQKTQRIKIRPFVTATASVSVKYGATIPTVPYGNVKVDVMLTMPCYREELLDVYEEVRKTADKLVEKEVARFEVGSE